MSPINLTSVLVTFSIFPFRLNKYIAFEGIDTDISIYIYIGIDISPVDIDNQIEEEW